MNHLGKLGASGSVKDPLGPIGLFAMVVATRSSTAHVTVSWHELAAILVAFRASARQLRATIARLTGQLVEAGLWRPEGPESWSFDPKDLTDIFPLRSFRAEAGRLGGVASGEARRAQVASRVASSAPKNEKREEGFSEDPDPDPDHRDPLPSAEGGVGGEASDPWGLTPPPSRPAKGGKRRALSPLDPTWDPRPEIYRWAAATEGVQLEADVVDHEWGKFADHAAQNDRRCKDWQAAFRNWLRMARDRRPSLPVAQPYREPPKGPPPLHPLVAKRFAEQAAQGNSGPPPSFQEAVARASRALAPPPEPEAQS